MKTTEDQAVPKIFTDEALENEKANLAKLIREAEGYKISSQTELNSANNKLRYAENALNGAYEIENRAADEIRARARNDVFFMAMPTGPSGFLEKHQQEVDKAYENIDSIKKKIEENERNLVTYKNQLEKLDADLQKKPIQRAEEHYQEILAQKHTIKDEKDGLELAKKFREIEGYKDSEELAKECEELGLRMQLDRLVQVKNRASTENEYQDLANQFRAMNGYENTTELANECENKCRILKEQRENAVKKAQYDRLVQEKNRASTENEYQNLAYKFRAMQGYGNTTELANECEKQCDIIKKQREKELTNAKRKQLFWIIFNTVLCGTIGGFGFAFLYRIMDGFWGFLLLGLILILIVGINKSSDKETIIWGCIVGLITGGWAAVHTKIPFITLGCIFSTIPVFSYYTSHNIIKKEILFWSIFAVISAIVIVLAFKIG